jgi:hypothetical protein
VPKWTIDVSLTTVSELRDGTEDDRDVELEVDALSGPEAVVTALMQIKLQPHELIHFIHVSAPH